MPAGYRDDAIGLCGGKWWAFLLRLRERAERAPPLRAEKAEAKANATASANGYRFRWGYARGRSERRPYGRKRLRLRQRQRLGLAAGIDLVGLRLIWGVD